MSAITPPRAEFNFKLRRLVLLDSYSPGGEAIIELADGAILTGENGAGKTSLLNMIPIFYGEHPSKCVSGSSSFSKFYLPHATSYVIFEYERRGVPCMAVLYGLNEASFGYRFVRSAYDLSLFTNDGDGATLVPEKDLKLRLKTAGVPHSEALGHKDYRNIIQGMVVGSRQKEVAEKRALVADYSFTDSGSQLLHIDKIVTGMFARKANFDDFLQVIVDYISTEGNTPISINGDKEKYADWPAQFAAYNEVMRYADLMHNVDGLSDQMKAGEGVLSVLHAKMIMLAKHLAFQQEVQAKEKARLSIAIETERSAADATLQKLQGDESKADADAGIIEERVVAIDAKSKWYQESKIEKKSAQVDAIPQMGESLRMSRTRKEVLLGESLKIEQSYQAMENNLGAEHLNKVQHLLTRIGQTRDHYEPLLAQTRLGYQEADKQVQAASETGISVMREAHHQAIEAKARCEAAVTNPVADPSIVIARDNKRAKLDVLLDKIHKAINARENLQTTHTQSIKEYVEQESSLNNLKRQAEQIEIAIQQVLSHLNPDETSLLHFLRESKPDWSADIAKVIREDVLNMGGLSPSFGEGNSLYGIQIDLSRLEGSLCASEVALQDKIAAHRAELDVIQCKIADAERLLAKCNIQRITAESTLKQHDAGTAVLQATEKTLKAELHASNQAVEQSKKAAKEDALAKLSEAKLEVGKRHQHIHDAQQSLQSARNACADKYAAIEKSIQQERDTAIVGIQGEIAQAEKVKAERLDQFAAEKKKALSESGVDTKLLQKLDDDIKTLGNDILAAEGWAKEVLAWRFWRDSELKERGPLAESAKQLRVRHFELSKAKKTETERWFNRQRELQILIAKVADSIGELGTNQRLVEEKTSRMDAYPPDRQTMLLPFDTSWTITHLFGQSMSLEAERKKLRLELEVFLRKIKAAFASSRGTPTEQFFLQTRSDVDPDDSDLLAWIAPLQRWFGRGHEDLRNTLMLYADTYGSLVTEFHNRLLKFHNEVGRFNTDIQKALDQTSRFRRITNITIRFESRLKELKYWDDVEAFTEVYQAWSRNSSEMPPPEFADRLKRLVSHWEMKEGIRAEPHKLIDIRGEVVENGNLKQFRNKVDLEKLSSNGLSYLILCSIFVAFLRKIRGGAKVQITWSVDELLDLDSRNIQDLLAMLKDNGICLFSACPDANLDIMRQFKQKYRVQRVGNQPELVECEVDMGLEEAEYV